MKLSQRSLVGGLALVLAVAITVSACAPNPRTEIISPQLGAQLYARELSGVVVAAPTPEPLRIATMSEEEIYAGLPEDFAAALAAATPSRGETLALANGCIGCHVLDPNQVMSGPTWYHMGDTAANRRAGVSPALYIYESIVAPNAYVVSGYPANVMPQNYGDTISLQDLADLVAYLLQQHE
jgi:mono/diheme cytochrome c family protein